MKKLIFHTLFLVLALTIVDSAQAQFNYKKKAGPATKDTVSAKPVEVAPVVVSTVAPAPDERSAPTMATIPAPTLAAMISFVRLAGSSGTIAVYQSVTLTG
jgi:hypothetical protein